MSKSPQNNNKVRNNHRNGYLSIGISVGAILISSAGYLFQTRQNTADIAALQVKVEKMIPASEAAHKDVTDIRFAALKEELEKTNKLLADAVSQARMNNDVAVRNYEVLVAIAKAKK